MIGRIFILFFSIACGEKETKSEATTEPSTEPSADTNNEPATEPASEFIPFSCGDTSCQEGQYCYLFVPGVPPDSGMEQPAPICETMPTECETDYSCGCLNELGYCTDCREDNGGLYCDMYAP